MDNREMKLTTLKEEIATFIRILVISKARPMFFVVQALVSIVIAFLEAFSMALLIPLTKGVIEKDFSFLSEIGAVKTIAKWFPQLFSKTQNTTLFLIIVIVIFFAAITKNVFHYYARVFCNTKKEIYFFNLKTAIFNRMLGFGKLYFDKTSQGYTQKIIQFASTGMNLVNNVGENLIKIGTLIFYLIIMVGIDWKLTIFSLLIFPILNFLLKYIIEKLRKTAKRVTETAMQSAREMMNTLSCIALVKAYNKEDDGKRRFEKINDDLKKYNISLTKKVAVISPLQEIILLAGMLLMISAVAFQFVKGDRGQVSAYMVFFLIVRRCVPLFPVFNNLKSAFAQSGPGLRKVEEIFTDKDKFTVKGGKRIFEKLEKQIEFRDVRFSYQKDTPILKGLNFTIEKGKTTAIVGSTGSGKTTMVSLIMRFYDCSPESIFVDDVDIREFSIESFNKHLALVSQDALLFNDTLRYNIIYGADENTSDEEVEEILKKARLHEYVQKLPMGLDAEVGDRGVKLSGGERQRVAIAQALLKGAEILILDEATSSLDTNTEKKIQEAIKEAIKGRTTIVIAHRLSTIQNADKIIVIEDGEIVEQGAVKELLEKKSAFYDYWEAQKFY
jgi:ATP-binding cassette, subfamily B, bacterial MsbA